MAVAAAGPAVADSAVVSAVDLVVPSAAAVVAVVAVVPRAPLGAVVAVAAEVASPVRSAGKSLMRCRHRWSAVCASVRAMARLSGCAVVPR